VAFFDDENVGGLDVPVDDAFGVSGVEAFGDFDSEVEEAVEVHGLIVDDVLQGEAIEEFHSDEGAGVGFADVINSADVGVVQGGGSFGFAAEAL